MKGVIVKEQGAPAAIVDDLQTPEPADDQVLVKSIYTAMNPVDAYMAFSGLLVLKWPLILGVDAAGIIVKAGSKAEGPLGQLKVGDKVLGCTRLGDAPYSTGQEHFLMDAALATPVPSNLSLAEAATVGVGFYTACLGVFGGLEIPIPEDPKNLPSGTGEWVLMLGGSSSVGKFALQLLKALGYKTITTCSPKSSEMIKSLGATETLDYKLYSSELVSTVLQITDGKVYRTFDAVASNQDFVKELYQKIEAEKFFSSTNDWTPMDSKDFNGAKINPVELGPIGRPDASKLNAEISKSIPLMYHMLETGAAKPAEYEIIGKTGFDCVSEAWTYQQSGKAGSKKVVVKLQDE